MCVLWRRGVTMCLFVELCVYMRLTQGESRKSCAIFSKVFANWQRSGRILYQMKSFEWSENKFEKDESCYFENITMSVGYGRLVLVDHLVMFTS